MILVPQEVRESLSWLEFTEEEEYVLGLICSTSPMLGIYGGDNDIIEAIRCSWEDSLLTSDFIGEDCVEFLEVNLFSKNELLFLVSDESPFYGLSIRGVLAPSERFTYLMSDVLDGKWAPLRMRNFWQEHLTQYEGDYLSARVALEFIEPESEPAEKVADKF